VVPPHETGRPFSGLLWSGHRKVGYIDKTGKKHASF
jgi:hypothetical protein